MRARAQMVLSGFLFLFILVLNLAMGALGYLMEKDEDAKKLTQEWNALIDPATVSVDILGSME